MMLKVAGVHHRLGDVDKFLRAVAEAERKGALYGVRLRPDHTNAHDPNAIEVHGFAGPQAWHIGFLDRDTALEINRDLIAKGIPIEAELYNVWRGDDGFLDVNVIVLAPPGHSLKKRVKR